MIKKLLFVGSLLLGTIVVAQEGETIDDLFELKYDSPLTIDLEEEVEVEEVQEEEEKKKKENPKIFFGIKTKRGFTKSGYGSNVVVELFHYLKSKDYEGPGTYTRDFYWYDFKKKKIVNSLRVKEDYAGVLHGHYVKKIGDQIIEEGYFYKGMKHGRWVRFNRHDILQDKEYYWKGWPRDAMMSYYDFEKTKLREVIPVHHGERNGDYYAFHEGGELAVIGQYKYGQKVGIWREYYPNRRLKREVSYPLEPFDFKTNPVITKEWDEKGQVIFDRKRYEARVN